MSGLAERQAHEAVDRWDKATGLKGTLSVWVIDRLWWEIAAALEAALEVYVAAVEDPHRAHLHYDGCPYKPFAALMAIDVPENVPACTCAETHQAAYWKGQFVLERSAGRLAVRAALEARDREWTATVEGSTGTDPVLVTLVQDAIRQYEGCARVVMRAEAAQVARDYMEDQGGPMTGRTDTGSLWRTSAARAIAKAIEALK